jgi:hypothetical protein
VYKIYIVNSNIIWFHFNDFKEICDLLDILEDNKAYVITFELIIKKYKFEFGNPSIVLSTPILIYKHSNPWLLSNYLNERIRLACDLYSLDTDWLELGNDGPGIWVKYQQINLLWE